MNSAVTSQETLSPLAITVGDCGPKGRGVFATSFFAAGQRIESAPVIVVPAKEWACMENTVLYNYGYAYGGDPEDMAIVLGYGSLYNHSYQPNAQYVRRIGERLLDFYAIRDIAPGEEITINYNGDAGEEEPLWFHVTE